MRPGPEAGPPIGGTAGGGGPPGPEAGPPSGGTAGGGGPPGAEAGSPSGGTAVSQADGKTAALSPTDAFSPIAGQVFHVPIPRVIQEAQGALRPPGSKGYHPAIALSLAAGHRWTPYGTFMSALRNLMLVDFEDSSSRSSARRYLSSLINHGVPFAVDRRFPDDEIYLCVDRAPLSFVLMNLSRELRKDAKQYYAAVQDAMDVVINKNKDALPDASPVLFGRSTFESVFQLQWSE